VCANGSTWLDCSTGVGCCAMVSAQWKQQEAEELFTHDRHLKSIF
jgi:hypothetical protein